MNIKIERTTTQKNYKQLENQQWKSKLIFSIVVLVAEVAAAAAAAKI